MAKVVLYTTQVCPYCNQAKALLKRKGVTEWEEIDVGQDPDLREEMVGKAGGCRTVPQIFINGQHVGGFDDLNGLEKKGELDGLLSGVA